MHEPNKEAVIAKDNDPKKTKIIDYSNKVDSKMLLAILGIILLLVVIGLPPILRIIMPSEEVSSSPTPIPIPTATPYIPIETDAPTNISGAGVIECTLYKEENRVSILDVITLVYRKAIVTNVDQTTTYELLSELDEPTLLDPYAKKCGENATSYSDFDGVDMICDSSNTRTLITGLIVDFNEFFEEDLLKHDPPIKLEFSNSDINDSVTKFTGLGYTCIGK